MRASEMRKKIIQKISDSDDKELLAGIYDLLKDESRKEMLLLSESQKRMLKVAEGEIAQNKFLTDKEVQARTRTWLGK
jgi:hypothetical protein